MKLSALTAVAALFWGSVAQAVPIVTFQNSAAGDFRVQSITGLSISGTDYDVAFQFGGSYDDFETFTSQPITFSTLSSATAATDALRAAVNAEMVDATPTTSGGTSTDSPGNFRVPWNTFGTTLPSLNFIGATRVATNPMFYSASSSFATSQASGSVGSGHSTVEWAAFSPSTSAVPEPGTLTLCSLLAGVAGLRYWRRRRRAAASA